MQFTLARLHDCINHARPHNGFITHYWMVTGWTAQPSYCQTYPIKVGKKGKK